MCIRDSSLYRVVRIHPYLAVLKGGSRRLCCDPLSCLLVARIRLPLRSRPILLRASRMSETDFRAHAIRCDNHRSDSIPVISEGVQTHAQALQNISTHPPAPICSLFCLCQRCQSVLCDVLVNSLCVCSVCPGAGTQAAQLPHCMHASIT